MELKIVKGDLLEQDVDAIVNAANTHLEHMGGIAGVISRAAGPEFQKQSRRLRPVATGAAVAQRGLELTQPWVINAVGPIWSGGNYHEEQLLASSHRSVLREAQRVGARSVAFPAVSCGIFGYPVDLAAPVAVDIVRRYGEHLKGIDEVRFVLLHPAHLAAFRAAAA